MSPHAGLNRRHDGRMPPRTTLGALRDLARASHPGPTVAVTATMTALAASAGRGTGTAWVFLAVLAGQLSVGWSNDYLDRVRDRAASRRAKPVAAGSLSPRLAGVAALTALAAAVGLSFASGWRAALAHLAGVAAAWAYNFGVKATPASPVPYAVAFGLLPAFVTLGLPGHPWPAWWAMTAGALLGIAAHFANVLPDMPDDLAAGVRGLPHRIGERYSRLLSAAALVAASLLLIVAPAWPGGGGGEAGPVGTTGPAGLALAAGVLSAGAVLIAVTLRKGTGTRGAFGVTVIVAVADVALLISRGAGIH